MKRVVLAMVAAAIVVGSLAGCSSDGPHGYCQGHPNNKVACPDERPTK